MEECRSFGMNFSISFGGNEGGGVLSPALRLPGRGDDRVGSPKITASAPNVAAFSRIFSRFESKLNHQLSTLNTAI
jgi:hypothetical protein